MNDLVDEIPIETEAEEKHSPPATAFIPRINGEEELQRSLSAVREKDSERFWGNFIKYTSGWFVATFMVVPLCYSISIIRNQPVPKDRIWVAMVHDDGTTMPARPIEDLTPSERKNIVAKFMYDYIDYRISYDAAHLIQGYNRTRFMSAGDAQTEYVDYMNNSPNRPTELYGALGEKRIPDQQAVPVGDGSVAWEVTYTLKIKTKQGFWLPDQHCRARITYAESKDMPGEVAQRLDPLKLVVTHFDNRPANYSPTTTPEVCGK